MSLRTSLLSALLVLQAALSLAQQGGSQPATVRGAVPAVSQAPSVSEIPVRLQQTAALVRRANSDAAPLGSIREIEQFLPRFQEGTRALLAANRDALRGQLSLGAVREMQNAWAVVGARLRTWQSLLKERSTSLQQHLDGLDREARAWTLAEEAAGTQQLPGDLQAGMTRAIEAIRAAQQAVLARRNVVLKLQGDISQLSIDVEEMGELLDEAVGAGRGRFLRLDSPPIWGTAEASRMARDTAGVALPSTRSAAEVLQYYVLSILRLLVAEAIVFVALLTVLLTLRKRAAAYRQDDSEAIRRLGVAIGQPASTAFILTVMASAVVMASAPAHLLSLGWYLLLFPLVRLVPALTARGVRPFLWTLVGLYLVDGATWFAPPSSPAWRSVELAVVAVEAGALVLYERRLRALTPDSRWKRAARAGVRVSVVVPVVAFFANLIGATDLSRYLAPAVLNSACAAAGLFASLAVLRGFLEVLLRSRDGRGNFGWGMPADLKPALSAGLTWLAFALYAVLLLRAFDLWEVLWRVAADILGYQVSVGALGFTLGSVFAFVAVLFVAVVSSRIARFFLAAGLRRRAEIARGTAEAVSKLAHYLIVTFGFLLAVGASGIDLNKFTFLAGALGVGVGIGLQSVVNNFVSGLILLFERPLHVGDTITVGDTSGEVKDIGIRSSTIATFDGADVLVPNASLTSASVVNWTLTDNRRRSELKVGVAHGTEPARVFRVLRETALEHPLVLRTPEPLPLFVGFGDSSLDFCLRYWTLLEHTVDVGSELYVSANARLAAEGIEIPFPRRDVHLRAVPTVR